MTRIPTVEEGIEPACPSPAPLAGETGPVVAEQPEIPKLFVSKFPSVFAFWTVARLRRHSAKLKPSTFVKNVLVVMTGTALAQTLGFALSPVISRLFTPSEFGVFGSFGAVPGVVSAGATLEYTQAIMLPKERGLSLIHISEPTR